MKEGYELRQYQRDFCNAVHRAFKHGTAGGPVRRVLGAAGTGAGKTVMADALTERRVERREKVLFLADRDELVEQGAASLHAATGIFADLEKGSSKASLKSDVVVGSIQSMTSNGRHRRFEQNHFGLVIADEAHLSMAPNWQSVLNWFDGAPTTNTLGITATPERGDGIPLMKWWEHLAHEIPMKTLIESRHLSPIMVRTVPLEIAIKGKVGDGEMEDVAAELQAYWQKIIDAIEEHCADRRSILIFHPSCKSSRDFSDELLKRGHASMHVQGDDPDRKETVAGFKRGDFRILNNAQMLTTGFDAPRVDCIIILRPTRSRTTYVQMAGRGTRLFCPHGCREWCDHDDRKHHMLLLDFLWQAADMNLMSPAFLTTDNKEQAAAMTRKFRDGTGKDQSLLTVDEQAYGEREEQMVRRLRKAAQQRGICIDARSFGAVFHQPELMDYQPTARWEMRPPTPKQLTILRDRGIDVATVKTLGQASQLLDFLFSRSHADMATAKQVMLMRERGIKDAHAKTFKEANTIIDNLMGNRRVPA